MRRLTTRRFGFAGAAAAAIVAAACASIAPPPGAPENHVPPALVAVTPDSGTVNQHPAQVVFRFSESINDRPPGGDLANFFVISPTTGATDVSYKHERLFVRPSRGFKPNLAYSITLLPGLTDFRGNTMKVGRTVVFSTGPTMPTLGALGRVYDWAAGRPLAGAVVQAIARPDSLVYVTTTDSAGGFTIGPFPPGRYTLLAFADQNRNRALDRGEAWDSVAVQVAGSRPLLELDAIVRDTIPPRLTSVSASDSVTLTLTFIRALDPRRPVGPADVIVQRADSSRLTVVSVMTPAMAERAHADSMARADSLRRATDTTRKATDTTKVDRSTGTGQVVTAAPLRPQFPSPTTTLAVKLSPATPLAPKSRYVVTVRNATSVTGVLSTSNRPLTGPAAPVKSDSTARRDSTAKRPARPPR